MRRAALIGCTVIITIATFYNSSRAAAGNDVKASLYGFEIGKKLSLPQCPDTPPDPLTVHKTCKALPSKMGRGDTAWVVVFPFFHAPRVIKDQILAISTMDGNIESVAFSTNGISAQDYVYKQLIDKFGTPTAYRDEDVQTAVGAHFKVRRARWDFGSFIVSFDGSDGNIMSGQVQMASAKFVAADSAWRARKNATIPKM